MTQEVKPTKRELEILKLVAKGLSNKEIAGKLFIEATTVRNHLRNVFIKLNAVSRVHAVMLVENKGYMGNYPGSVYKEAWDKLYESFSERMQQDELDLMDSILLSVTVD